MQWLDANPDVKAYEYEAFSIEYLSNKRTGKIRKYFPDFLVHYVDGSRRLVEVKPISRVGKRANQKKLEAAKGWCSAHGVTLEIVTEVTLKGLGLL